MFKGYTELVVEQQKKLLLVQFNNPKKKNCLNRFAYIEITRVLCEAAQEDQVTIVVFTGTGDFYSAGNDLSQFENVNDLEASITESIKIFKEMVKAFVECPKVIVSLVNGPCIGIGTTLAGLSDMVWCSKKAYFTTPFVKLGIVPEAASSYMFPLIMGRSKATEMLLFGEKLLPHEALQYHFVSRVYKPSELNTVIWPKLIAFSELPPQSLQISKTLLRNHEKSNILQAIHSECDELYKRFHSEEFFDAIIRFNTKKSNL
uniref:Enoyl-CoA delta isomerase 2, mitochondrial n=1 Tax=Glossina morsitans morsitans TaxID=37546 RepID=A0A1B0G332_GLOMM